ncbi:hypothetical protein JTB14_015656 [Gonioctena quinquepunctata]|nr:hypothetical protein JTB14_015656 [Gonioctena quinquepunctata]
MQIRNGHLNDGFNSRKPSSASTKAISKYNLLHSYFECNFRGEYSKRIAQEFKRQVKCCNKYKQVEPTFIDDVREKILFVHNYNVKVSEVAFAYPLSNEFVELLREYVLIECRAVYRRKDRLIERETVVQDRLLRLLMHIFNTYFESKMVPSKEIFEKSARAIINIFIEIRRDHGVHNKLMENMTIKLLKKMGHYEKIEALKGKNLPCPLDTYLSDHAFSEVYKTAITSDYGTDDGFQVDDEVQIVDESVDVTATERNEIKEEDFDSDEDMSYFTEEVKTSAKSLDYRKRQLSDKRQKDCDSFHEKNHRPMDEVKIEDVVKIDLSEENNISDINFKSVDNQSNHSHTNLISNETVVLGGETNRKITITEIVEISDDESEEIAVLNSPLCESVDVESSTTSIEEAYTLLKQMPHAMDNHSSSSFEDLSGKRTSAVIESEQSLELDHSQACGEIHTGKPALSIQEKMSVEKDCQKEPADGDHGQNLKKLPKRFPLRAIPEHMPQVVKN